MVGFCMSFKVFELGQGVSEGLRVKLNLVEVEAKLPVEATIHVTDSNGVRMPCLRLNLKKNRFNDEDLLTFAEALQPQGDLLVDSSEKELVANVMQSKAEEVSSAVIQAVVRAENDKNRIVQLAANRARLEEQIADINRELNGLLKPEIERITY